eukprot:TRINITY_DN3658_c0_g2_i5.p1 TRINITY_DN3658_c0_g2~~TRINITY_DN3658_c0_g2_i5.p1  ORF type:complete len:311 (-),score=68.48 TRINITY_DN3658_c0_g2_i5:32-964(-)
MFAFDMKGFLSLGIWYVFNIATLILNKYLFQIMKFTYPLTLTSIHMLVCTVGTWIIIDILKIFPRQAVPNKSTTVWPLGALFCFNIVLGNISLRWIAVSFMQTIKSSVPAFTCLMQLIFLNIHLSTPMYLSLIPIVGGVALASFTEANFEMIGFMAAFIASITTAIQTILSGYLLKDLKLDSTNLLSQMAPVALVLLTPFAMVLEWGRIPEWQYYGEVAPVIILCISGSLALALNFTTFLAISHTSALTFNVAGNLKVVLSVCISVAIFKNEITFLNGIGCALAIGGVILYNHLKFLQNQAKSQASVPAK